MGCWRAGRACAGWRAAAVAVAFSPDARLPGSEDAHCGWDVQVGGRATLSSSAAVAFSPEWQDGGLWSQQHAASVGRGAAERATAGGPHRRAPMRWRSVLDARPFALRFCSTARCEWDVAAVRAHAGGPHLLVPNAVACSAEMARPAVSGSDAQLRVWDVTSGKACARFKATSPLSCGSVQPGTARRWSLVPRRYAAGMGCGERAGPTLQGHTYSCQCGSVLSCGKHRRLRLRRSHLTDALP